MHTRNNKAKSVFMKEGIQVYKSRHKLLYFEGADFKHKAYKKLP